MWGRYTHHCQHRGSGSDSENTCPPGQERGIFRKPSVARLSGFAQPDGRIIRLKRQIQSWYRFAVPIWVIVWLISSRVQDLAKNTVESGQNSDMSTKS